MSGTPEVKPCPCCGVELVEIDGFSTRTQKHFWHERNDADPCVLSDFRVIISDKPHHIQRLESWNRRVAPPITDEHVERAAAAYCRDWSDARNWPKFAENIRKSMRRCLEAAFNPSTSKENENET